MKTFKRSAAEQDIPFYHNFDILMIFLGLNVILYCIFWLFKVILKFYYCIFIRLLNATIYENPWCSCKHAILRYRAPIETSLKAEWATLCR